MQENKEYPYFDKNRLDMDILLSFSLNIAAGAGENIQILMKTSIFWIVTVHISLVFIVNCYENKLRHVP